MENLLGMNLSYTSKSTSLIFYVDTNGVYHRGEGFFLGTAGALFYVVATIPMIVRKCIREWDEDRNNQKSCYSNIEKRNEDEGEIYGKERYRCD